MGTYNPYAPALVGEEWVPIRNEGLSFAPDNNTYEQGYSFVLPTATQIGDARFYVSDYPQGDTDGQAFMASIYARGTAASAGPVRSVIIPCNSVGVTGSGTSGTISSVKSPSDDEYMSLPLNVTTTAGFFFNVDAYPFLNGKRILGVDFLYTAGFSGITDLAVGDISQNFRLYSPVTMVHDIGNLDGEQDRPFTVQRASIGEATPVPTATFITVGQDRLPWRYVDLQRLQFGNSSRMQVTIVNGSVSGATASDTYIIGYAALEVFYCEERRVAVGGTNFGSANSSTDWQLGMNKMTMRNATTYAASPVLAAGEYDLVLSSPSSESFRSVNSLSSGRTTDINALRELFSIPSHPGIKVSVPQNIDDEFTQETTHILPQISLHASGTGATIIYPHVYGRQAPAPVYGSVTATQEIDPAPGQITTYPQVRFYARRFGNTKYPLKIASTSYASATASITPAEFDELEEIIDGWKEVTLRFTTPPTFIPSGAVIPWQWTSTGEVAGSRWEVLAARAPAVSGIATNYTQEVPSAQRLGTATYYSANGGGATTALTWQLPPASGIAEDPAADAALVFAQDPPTISGFAVSVASQAVSGIGDLCNEPSGCDITGLYYHQLVWNAYNAGVLTDTFDRAVASNGWGTSTSGATWTVGEGSSAVWSTDGSSGVMTPAAASTSYVIVGNVSMLNSEMQAEVSVPALLGTQSNVYLVSRYTDANNSYRARFTFNTDGTSDVGWEKVVAGVTTTVLAVASTGTLYAPGESITIKSRVFGSVLMAKSWRTGDEEPLNWMAVATDTSLTSAGFTGMRAFVGTTDAVMTVENFTSSWAFGAFEIQRKDTIDTDYATIMLATSPLITSFKDYEARVGVVSTYRMRLRNVYDFAGAWSSEVTSTLTSPGVTTSASSSPNGALIFTTNEYQDGAGNLAYVETWDKAPQIEDFTFPEADNVTLQRMYGKDYFTAFHPEERGGERFSRTLLIRNAAVSGRVLDNIADALRDLAWDSLSYLCVRTDDGDRWFANVIVPDATTRRKRQLHLVRIEITEVTATPTQVDPEVS